MPELDGAEGWEEQSLPEVIGEVVGDGIFLVRAAARAARNSECSRRGRNYAGIGLVALSSYILVEHYPLDPAQAIAGIGIAAVGQLIRPADPS